MNKTAYLCIFLLLACIGVARWHHNLDNQFHTEIIEGDLYIMEALVDRIEERDAYIERLEAFITAQNEKQEAQGQVQPAE